ncbi:D-aminoacyl-tRNA deacylase [Furfurilactobacillus entadae]|uniref:D-aminoacyl-tRNA deacylase n=1 Tax=Furfurilactobacillus entadae TaxID=2922307 RepID=UPI0035E872DE
MRVLAQRVRQATVTIDGQQVGAIDHGLLLLVGIAPTDTAQTVDYLAKKILNSRLFSDEDGKMNKSVQDVAGAILSVSQFTLYADLVHGNRPGFSTAATPEIAEPLWARLNQQLAAVVPLETGEFGADMQVSLVNDGPVTLLFERD